jgi:hypothetical protein
VSSPPALLGPSDWFAARASQNDGWRFSWQRQVAALDLDMAFDAPGFIHGMSGSIFGVSDKARRFVNFRSCAAFLYVFVVFVVSE